MTTTSFHAKDNLRKKNILWVSAEAKTRLIREKHEKNNLQSLTWNPQEFRTSYHCSVFATLETPQENKLLQTNYIVCKNIYRLLFKAFLKKEEKKTFHINKVYYLIIVQFCCTDDVFYWRNLCRKKDIKSFPCEHKARSEGQYATKVSLICIQ